MTKFNIQYEILGVKVREMLEKTFGRMARFQEKYPMMILLAVLLLTILMGFYAVQLKTDSSFDVLYRDDSDYIQKKELVSNEFGSTDGVFILVEIDDDLDDENKIQDIRHPDVLASMKSLSESIRRESTVASVFSVVDILEARYGRLPETLEESKEFFSGLGADTSRYLSDDYSASNIVVDINIASKPGSLEKAEEVMREKIENAMKPVGVHYELTGQPILLNRIMNLLINDNLVTVGIAIVAILIILSIFFRSGPVGFVAVVPVCLTLLWLAGTMVLLDIRITMMTAAVGAMMVGMGVDYSIHMTHGFVERLKKGVEKVTQVNSSAVGGALAASALTTVAGFLAMLVGSSPSSKIQGTVLSFGIVYAFLATMIVLPCLLVIYKKLTFGDLDKIMFRLDREEKGSSLMQPLLKLLARLQVRMPWLILMGFIVLTILLLPGMGLVRFDTDNENWIPENDPVIEAQFEVGAKFGGLETQNFLVMLDSDVEDRDVIKDLRDPIIIRKLFELEKTFEKISFVNFLSTPAGQIREINGGKLPKEKEDIKDIVEDNERIQTFYNDDYSIMKISAFSDGFGGETGEARQNYNQMLYEIESVQIPYGVEVEAQGGLAQWLELDDSLQTDTIVTTLLGFVLVFLLALILYRSFTAGSLALIPIIFSAIWTVGIMGYIDLPFTVLTSGMLAIVMGLGIDFSIHLIHNTKLALSEGKSIMDSVLHSLTTIGEAIFVSTFTTAVGFTSLILASLLVTQRLGFTLSIAILAAFVSCMVLVPATLVIEYRIKKRVKGDI